MTDQELRRLSRADLIDIIYTLQQQKEQAEQQLAQAQAQLQDRQLRLASAGSIAGSAAPCGSTRSISLRMTVSERCRWRGCVNNARALVCEAITAPG